MRRRLLVSIVGTVAAALVSAGLGTLVLARLGARDYAERELRRDAHAVAEALPVVPTSRPGSARGPLLLALRGALRLEGVALVPLDGIGPAEGVQGVELTSGELDALAAGATLSGRDGQTVWAAAPLGSDARRAVLVSDRIGIALGGTAPWFVLSAALVIAGGTVVAARLARALADPLRNAEQVAHRIAAGDLQARLPDPGPERTDEVADLTRSINAMASAIERSRGLERQFLLSVSHDLRTPLTSIRGYAEAVADGTAPDPGRAAEVILAESQRLERLVADLLQLARLEARAFDLQPTVVPVGQAVAATVDGFARQAADAGVQLLVRSPPERSPAALVDPDRLAQVVANLVENALRFARSRVEVDVVSAPSPDQPAPDRDAPGAALVRIEVDDDGPGIDPADQPHVFERLYVARHRPDRSESGSGLGLAIVRELVVAMGGTVGAGTSPLGGARLWVSLPAHRMRR